MTIYFIASVATTDITKVGLAPPWRDGRLDLARPLASSERANVSAADESDDQAQSNS